jgi:hypothetical protein
MLNILLYPCGGCIGIWTADLKKRTNLQQLQVNKALKNLESRSLVKPVKTVSVIPLFYHCRLLISVQGWFELASITSRDSDTCDCNSVHILSCNALTYHAMCESSTSLEHGMRSLRIMLDCKVSCRRIRIGRSTCYLSWTLPGR